MSEHPNRNTVRSEIATGGWSIIWGDLTIESDVIALEVTFPTGTIETWVSQQVEVQLQKFSQDLDAVSDDVVNRATDYLKSMLGGKNFGQLDIDGLGVKAGIATYNSKLEDAVGDAQLPNHRQSYIGLRVTKPLPLKGTSVSFNSRSWYKITNASKPGMALDVVNDGNQRRDG